MAFIVTANSMFMRQMPAQQVPAKPIAGIPKENFVDRPDSARPGGCWYIMDGNLDGSEMTAGCRVDLPSPSFLW